MEQSHVFPACDCVGNNPRIQVTGARELPALHRGNKTFRKTNIFIFSGSARDNLLALGPPQFNP